MSPVVDDIATAGCGVALEVDDPDVADHVTNLEHPRRRLLLGDEVPQFRMPHMATVIRSLHYPVLGEQM